MPAEGLGTSSCLWNLPRLQPAFLSPLGPTECQACPQMSIHQGQPRTLSRIGIWMLTTLEPAYVSDHQQRCVQEPLSSTCNGSFSFCCICFNHQKAKRWYSINSQLYESHGIMEQKSSPDWVGDCILGMALRGCGPRLYLKPSIGDWCWPWARMWGCSLPAPHLPVTPTHSQSLECHVIQLLAAQMNQTSHNWHSGTQELRRVSRAPAGRRLLLASLSAWGQTTSSSGAAALEGDRTWGDLL